MEKKEEVVAALLLLVLLCGCTQQRYDEVIQMKLKVTSPAFRNMEKIPVDYTCDGRDINPPLDILDIPDGTKSLVLIVEDPDAPTGVWDHWIVWNIPPTEHIREDSKPGIEGINSFNRAGYGGPCPPSGTHRYYFRVYALDTNLDVMEEARKKDVTAAMRGHVIAEGELIGTYSRS